MKKVVSIVIVSMLILVGGLLGVRSLFSKSVTSTELIQAAILVSDTHVKLLRGLDNRQELEYNQKYISPEVFETIDAFYNSLVAKNELEFNVTEYYYTNIHVEGGDYNAGVGSGASADDHLLMQYQEDYEEPETEEEVFEEDPRIFYKEDTAYIKVRDLEFGLDGYDIVSYNGVHMLIPESHVEQTYDRMKEDPNNFYVYKAHKEVDTAVDRFIDVLYESPNSKETLMIRVFHDGKKLLSYEER